MMTTRWRRPPGVAASTWSDAGSVMKWLLERRGGRGALRPRGLWARSVRTRARVTRIVAPATPCTPGPATCARPPAAVPARVAGAAGVPSQMTPAPEEGPGGPSRTADRRSGELAGAGPAPGGRWLRCGPGCTVVAAVGPGARPQDRLPGFVGCRRL